MLQRSWLIGTATLVLMWGSVGCVYGRGKTPPPPPKPEPAKPQPVADEGEPSPIDTKALVFSIDEAPAGMSAEQATQWLAPTRQRLGECRPSAPGIVHVRIEGDAAGTEMTLDDGSALDAATRHCILHALSFYDEEVWDEAVPDPAGDDELVSGGMDALPGLSSQITIGW